MEALNCVDKYSEIFGAYTRGHSTSAGEYDPGGILQAFYQLLRGIFYLRDRSPGQHIPGRNVSKHGHLEVGQLLQLIQVGVKAHVKEVDSHFWQVMDRFHAAGIIVEEFHRMLAVIELLEVGEAKLHKLILAYKTDDIIQHKDPVDGWKERCLVPVKSQQVVSDLPEQQVGLLGMGHQGHHKLRGSHQVGGDIERTA